MTDAHARRLVEARLGRAPQDALEAAVVLEAWAGMPAQRALETARAIMPRAFAPPAAGGTRPAAPTRPPEMLLEGAALLGTVCAIALWAEPLAAELGAGVVGRALTLALPLTLGLQWALRARHLGRPSGLEGLRHRRAALVAGAVLVVAASAAALGAAGVLAGLLVVTWTSSSVLLRSGWVAGYAAIVACATAAMLAGAPAREVVAAVAALTAAAAVLALRPARTDEPKGPGPLDFAAAPSGADAARAAANGGRATLDGADDPRAAELADASRWRATSNGTDAARAAELAAANGGRGTRDGADDPRAAELAAANGGRATRDGADDPRAVELAAANGGRGTLDGADDPRAAELAAANGGRATLDGADDPRAAESADAGRDLAGVAGDARRRPAVVPGRWSRTVGAALTGVGVGVLLVGDPGVGWAGGAAVALALLPSAAGGLWAGHALWRLADAFPKALSGVAACDGPRPSVRRPVGALADAIARLAVVTAGGSALLLAFAPRSVGAGILAGFGVIALAGLLVALLESLGRPLWAAAGVAAGVAAELLAPSPFAGAGLVAGGTAAVLVMVPAAFVLLARPARTLATALWIT